MATTAIATTNGEYERDGDHGGGGSKGDERTGGNGDGVMNGGEEKRRSGELPLSTGSIKRATPSVEIEMTMVVQSGAIASGQATQAKH